MRKGHHTVALLVLSALAPAALALHDPTRPTDPDAYFGNGNRERTTPWSLQSILSSPERRIAIINGTTVREGERIGSAKVLSIRKSQVLLDTGERTLTLRLRPETSKVTP